MIHKLSVKNFKSIKQLEIDCRRINLFIGEPNAGKSNILETLGLLSRGGHSTGSLNDYVRFQYAHNLFYDGLTDEAVEIEIESDYIKGARLRYSNERLTVIFKISESEQKGTDSVVLGIWQLDSSGKGSQEHFSDLSFIKYYTFEKQSDFQGKESFSLMPPHGSNMFTLVSENRKLKASMARFFKDFGFKLVFRTHENAFEFQKQIEDEDMDSIIQYPYILASDTMQRMIFYTIAIESNENSALIFEEPESHTFPYYTGQLGERIAFDEKNQYFIATHNPYFFLSVLEKVPKDDVNVFITYFQDYQTKVKCLDDEEKSKIMVYDPFANLDYFLGSLDSFVEEEG